MKKISTIFSILIFFIINIINSQNLYDINNITIIELTFEETNWDQILVQYHNEGNGDRLLAHAIVNGVEFDSVGVRYKGHSTFQPNAGKKPLNIKLNYIINQDYQGFKTLKLSNGVQDPSFVREVVSYEIARKYMVAPLSNYAKVFINGELHGLYSSSESINGDFGKRYLFADKKNPRFKCNPPSFSNGSGLTFLGLDSTAYFESYEIKTDYGWNGLVNIIDILNNDPENIETILNIDRAIWMLAFDNVLVNLDSYIGIFRQNYYLIQDDNDIFNTVVWDMNESLGGFENVGGMGSPNVSNLIGLEPDYNSDSAHPLMQLIIDNDTYRRMYIAHCRTILEENFTNGWYETRGHELQNVIDDAVQSDPNAIYSYNKFVTNMDDFVPHSGPPPGGVPGAFGITQIFEPRTTFLQNHPDYQLTPPSIFDIMIVPEVVPEFTEVTITVEVENAGNVILGYRFGEEEIFLKENMFDDGNHQDGATGDGVFGIQIQTNTSDIQYFIYAENDAAGIFSPERAEHEFYEIEVIMEVNDIVINEFMADNTTTISDQNDEYDDWIELYNNTNEQLSLTGYYLSDDEADLLKWSFPDTVIEANGYLIVWADKDEEQEGLHTNFKLSKNGEGLYLSVNTTIVDQIVFGVQNEDMTTGRYPNGTGDFCDMSPTFNGENMIATGISEIERVFVKIYPNPASKIIKIETGNLNPMTFQIYDIVGNLLLSDTMRNEKTVDINNFPTGVYLLRAGNSIYRFVIL